jgi:hypothetical protein
MPAFAETFPWVFSGAIAALDGPYAIGVIYSLPLGCAIISVGHDGPDMAENISKTNSAAAYIVESCNARHEAG